MLLELQTLVLAGDRVVLPIAVRPPVQRGSVDLCLAASRGGAPAHPTLRRTVPVTDGVIAPLVLCTRDIQASWPRGGRGWLVIRYADQLLATGPVALVPG